MALIRYKIIFSLIIMLLISCSRDNKNLIQNNYNQNIDMEVSELKIDNNEQESFISEEFKKYNHIVKLYINNIDQLPLRFFPDIDSKIIGYLDYMTKLIILEENNEIININGIEGKMVYVYNRNPLIKRVYPMGGWVFDGYLSEIELFIDELFDINKLSIIGVWEKLEEVYDKYIFFDDGKYMGGILNYEVGKWQKEGNLLTIKSNYYLSSHLEVFDKDEETERFKIYAIDKNIIIFVSFSDDNKIKEQFVLIKEMEIEEYQFKSN